MARLTHRPKTIEWHHSSQSGRNARKPYRVVRPNTNRERTSPRMSSSFIDRIGNNIQINARRAYANSQLGPTDPILPPLNVLEGLELPAGTFPPTADAINNWTIPQWMYIRGFLRFAWENTTNIDIMRADWRGLTGTSG